MSNKGEHFDEEINVDMSEVGKQGLPSTTLQLYLTFSQKLFITADQSLFCWKESKKDMVLVDVWASSLMEDRKN